MLDRSTFENRATAMRLESAPPEIENPCPKLWDMMSGDDKRRYCEHCQHHVHNLSAMSAAERESLLAKSSGRVCIAYEMRPDGSMITPSRWSKVLRTLTKLRMSLVGILAAILPFAFSGCACRDNRRVMGMMPKHLYITPENNVQNQKVMGRFEPHSET